METLARLLTTPSSGAFAKVASLGGLQVETRSNITLLSAQVGVKLRRIYRTQLSQ
jgi:hypothetical protein